MTDRQWIILCRFMAAVLRYLWTWGDGHKHPPPRAEWDRNKDLLRTLDTESHWLTEEVE